MKDGRPKYFGEAMRKYDFRLPGELVARLKATATQLSEQAGRRITSSDLVRTAAERLLKEISGRQAE